MNCARCGKPFEKKTSRQKYCSFVCYNRAKSERWYRKNGRGKGVCSKCLKEYTKSRHNQKYCSIECSSESQRRYLTVPQCLEKANRKIDKNLGYVRIYAPMHKEANTWGYVYEHRLIAEQVLNRSLKKNEVVHHINGIRWDNRRGNLAVMSSSDHSKLGSSLTPHSFSLPKTRNT